MVEIYSFLEGAIQQLEKRATACRSCFSSYPFDGGLYIRLCEARRKARLFLERVEWMYEMQAEGGEKKEFAAPPPALPDLSRRSGEW